MAGGTLSNIHIAGVASAVPAQRRSVSDESSNFDPKQSEKISQKIGVRFRHVVTEGVCTSDLCEVAAKKLLGGLGVDPSEIGGVIFVSQTPDYVLPATSQALHGRLGLPPECFAFDVNLGCSGYVYGLWLAGSLLQPWSKRILLLVGDTISKVCSPEDPSVTLVFGDAGTATLLEYRPGAPEIEFELGTDGSGEKKLCIPAGGFRYPRNAASAVRTQRDGSNIRSDQDLFMNGAEVFTFTISRVPELVTSLLHRTGVETPAVDAFVFHQANRFMLEHLAKRIKINLEKLPLSLEEYGNTSSASIPLTLGATDLRERLEKSTLQLLLAGFGVGFSWAAALVKMGPGYFPEVIEVPALNGSG